MHGAHACVTAPAAQHAHSSRTWQQQQASLHLSPILRMQGMAGSNACVRVQYARMNLHAPLHNSVHAEALAEQVEKLEVKEEPKAEVGPPLLSTMCVVYYVHYT